MSGTNTVIMGSGVNNFFANDSTVNWDITGNTGANVISGDALNDTINGGDGADLIDGKGGVNYLNGDDGQDTFFAGDALINNIDGGADEDAVDYNFLGVTNDVTASLADGYGTVLGHFGIDYYTNIEDLVGGIGNDHLTGDGNANRLDGNDGNDTLEGGGGNDKLFGGDNDDVLVGGGGADELHGDGGVDTVSYVDATSGVEFSLADGGTVGIANGDSYFDVENGTGSNFDDTLKGDGKANVLDGGKGDDLFQGGGGADTFIGGDGKDTVSFENAQNGVTVSLADSTGTGGDGAQLTFDHVENLTGSDQDDTFTGDSGKNVFDGGDGADTLNGKGGNDTLNGDGGKDILIGGLGADTLTGGAGFDTYQFNSMQDSLNSPGKFDTITNFQSGEKIDLSGIDADTGAKGDQAFTLVANFSGNAGEVRSFVDATTGDTIVQAYDGTDNFQVDLTTSVTLTTSNFVF
jgi:Ca2+-binding RTX toxin-like protein